MEIERKWLISSFPSDMYAIKEQWCIDQLYLYTDPEVRILNQYTISDNLDLNTVNKLTLKTDGTLSREEVEIDIPDHIYSKIFKMINKDPIHKQYRVYEFAGFNVEMSCVDGDFYYAEVEFYSENEAKEFIFPFPEIVIKEVTDDPKYKMKNYWSDTRLNKTQ